MSRFLLDTNIPSELMRSSPELAVARWVAGQAIEALYLSVVSIGELQKRFTIMPEGKRRTQLRDWLETALLPLFQERVLPVTDSAAERWGTLDGTRQMMGRPLSVPDGLIAATALEHDLTVVTRNIRDFDGWGVSLIDPWQNQ